MKNRILVMLGLAATVGVLSACGADSALAGSDSAAQIADAAVEQDTAVEQEAAEAETAQSEARGETYSVVTTIFPTYDWVKEITKDSPAQVEITYLLDSGEDLHNYQPTAEDIAKIAECDMFIYVGGESDDWVEDALAESVNENMQVINLLETLGDSVKEEEVVEGMEAEHEHDDADETHEHEDADDTHEDEHEHEEDEIEYDEHVWLSLRNSEGLVRAIADAMSVVDSANAEVYGANATAYIAQLADLDAQYEAAVAAADQHTVLFGDRFPFRYLADDYDLDYYAAFVGCSAETEASFETIVFLAGKVDALGLSTVLTIEGSDQTIAETIISSTASKDQTIAVMNSLQAISTDDIAAGTTYLSVMQENLEVLKAALQ